jgi:hypothetical protein
VEAGFGHLVGLDRKTITRVALEFMEKSPTNLENPLGEGQAASRISSLARDFLKELSFTI